MLTREITLARFARQYFELLTADLEDDQLTAQPAAGVNHPAWIIGHLAVTTDMGVTLLGGAPSCPPEWKKLFGPGSKVQADRALYPSKGELVAAFRSAHKQFLERAATLSNEQLAQPWTGVLHELLPTQGDILAHLLATHPAVHLGQLSQWRRTMGLKPVLNI